MPSKKSTYKTGFIVLLTLPAFLVCFGLLGCENEPENEDPLPGENEVYQGGASNNDGQVVFDDNETVTINILDDNDQPIEGINVGFINGDEFEVFITQDPENQYYPTISIYTHNSWHDIILTLIEDVGEYLFTLLTGTELEALGNWISFVLDNETHCDAQGWGAHYNGTYYGNQVADVLGFSTRLAILLGGASGGGDISIGNLVSLPDAAGNMGDILEFEQNLQQVYGNSNWDRYNLGFDFGNFSLGMPTFIRSNEPQAGILEPEVNESSVTITGTSADATSYGGPILGDSPDYTITCLGPTQYSDITFEFFVYNSDGVLTHYQETISNQWTFNDLEEGSYTTRVRAIDETEINQTFSEVRGFEIGGEDPVFNGRIAFLSTRDGNEEIYIMNADGTNQTRLTFNSSNDAYPAISPDGSRIAFTSNRNGSSEIYVMNIDGSDQTRLTNTTYPYGDYYPSWSPDGSMIAFYSSRSNDFDIYTMNADGSDITQLTNAGTFNGYPSWNPNGNLIAFDSTRDGNSEIYVMNSDGSNQTRLTYNPTSGNNNPAWSPEGNMIAFFSGRDGNSEIYVMNSDGSNQNNLTNNSAGDWNPCWSPDGSMIAFDRGEIYVMNSDGSNQTRLTNTASSINRYPSWGPE